MEHPCSRCGAAVDNSSPFCQACEAPQVVYVAREPAPGPVRLHPATIPPLPVQVSEPSAQSFRPTVLRRDSDLLRAAIYAGAIGTLLSTLPLGFVIGLPLSGVLAVRFYMSSLPLNKLPGAFRFRLGALSGLVAFGMLVAVRTITIAIFGGGSELRQVMVDAVHRAQSVNPDPQSQQMLLYFLTPQGMAIMAVLGLLFMCVVFVLLAGLGGLVSTSVLPRKPSR